MSYVQIPNELFKINLSSLQFRFLVNFIRLSVINNGHSFFGYPNLAKINQCGKVAAIKTVKELENMGFIQVIERGNCSRSNDILLTLDKGLSRLNSGGNDERKEGYLKDTPSSNEGYLNDTRGYLNDTREYKKNTPHKDLKDLNNINLNNIYNEGCLNDTPRVNSKYIESNDVTFDKTMPDGGQAAGSSASNQIGSEFGENDKKITAFINRKYPNFKAWYTLSRDVHGSYFINPITSFVGRIIPNSDVVTLAPDGVSVCSYPANEMRGNFVKII